MAPAPKTTEAPAPSPVAQADCTVTERPVKRSKHQPYGEHIIDEEFFHSVGKGTSFVHAGSDPDPTTGAVVPAISLATTYRQFSPGQFNGFEYSRSNNPTREKLEESLATAEQGGYAITFASGSAATAAVVHALCVTGDQILCIDDVYGGTQRYFRKQVEPIYGIKVDFVNFDDEEAVEKAAIPGKLKFLWLETPTNPTLKVTSIAKTAALAHKLGAKLVVDNTFMSPYLQRPLLNGADIVTHSCTKSIGGHSDVVMGVVVTKCSEAADSLRFHQNSLGAVPSPFESYMCQRGLKTLHVRMQRSCENAEKIAHFLDEHPYVSKVNWPFHKSHPQYEVAKEQQTGGGMVITFWIKGDTPEEKLVAAKKFLSSTRVFMLAESLGAVESLAEHPVLMTHASVPVEIREKLGINNALIRLSVGIEDADDLLADLDRALNLAKEAVEAGKKE